MSGRVLIVDSIATNRILLRAVLHAAHFEVTPCGSIADARLGLAQAEPDIVLLDISGEPADALSLCASVKTDPAFASVRVIALAAATDHAARITALKAGADSVLVKGVDDQLLLATIRNLLRARNAAAELSLREESDRIPGFAEAAGGFAAAGRVAVVTGRPNRLPNVLTMLMDRLPGPSHVVSAGQDLTDANRTPLADLYIFDAASGQTEGPQPVDLIRMIADLRSRIATHYAATMVILPGDAQSLAAMALDLGANDQADDDICVDELAYRVRNLLRRKIADDLQRDQLQFQLQAANIDSLTGLVNRRCGERRLARIIEDACETGKEFAVMMLDIDHFKVINDTHGHDTGDRVLIEVAHRLRDNVRAVDLLARVGGEEFLIVMPETTAEQARGAAERMRRVIEGAPFDCPVNLSQPSGPNAAGIHVTLSIGVAVGPFETPPGASTSVMADRLRKSADIALYEAKSAGRNMVQLAQSAA